MQLQTRSRHALSFNFTSLIDMVFLLNIFFIVAASLAQEEIDTTITLPINSASDGSSTPPDALVVTINSLGELSCRGRPLSALQLRHEIEATIIKHARPPNIQLRVDRATHYADVEPALLQCVQANVSTLSFTVATADSN